MSSRRSGKVEAQAAGLALLFGLVLAFSWVLLPFPLVPGLPAPVPTAVLGGVGAVLLFLVLRRRLAPERP